ncbi:hypothetical protein TVAG_321740 [Trichomonas vaginalis G3]|uniref:Uncharacterized protein n=1 Tax=Trichomonas vaginalis (strain ATCC PRA-98 / G3) TaxID=412133 RepID=A2FQF2_TRIV3|nr:hypothetical protein TVAGG3_0482180 [Trichomonas vaginalis G3]EAX92860.1 hypothetical protein TVAG_321740 [Trichomonas vaginalis G3]KAI5515788.1 hypothetical protein TVAGG3_0482180 [Trichomonas vaginalis G3]|eukprot:XP_001305790.1 hypothetical protein [Trichomonas vaginalis G3]
MLLALELFRGQTISGLLGKSESSVKASDFHYDVSQYNGTKQFIDCSVDSNIYFDNIAYDKIYLNMKKITFSLNEESHCEFTVNYTQVNTFFTFSANLTKVNIYNVAGYRHHLISRATFNGRSDLEMNFPLSVSKQASGPNIVAKNGFKLSTESNINMFNIVQGSDNSKYHYHASRKAQLKEIRTTSSTLISGEGIDVEGIYGTDSVSAVTSTAEYVHAKEFYGQSGVVDFSGNFSFDHMTLNHSKLTFTNLEAINAFGSIHSAIKARKLKSKDIQFQLDIDNMDDLAEGTYDVIYAPDINCENVQLSTSIHYIGFPFLYGNFYGEKMCTSNKITIKITKHEPQTDFCITKDQNKCPENTVLLNSSSDITTISNRVNHAVSVFKIWCFKDYTEDITIDMNFTTAVEFDGDKETVYLSDDSISNLNVVVSRGLNVHYNGNLTKTSIMILRCYNAGINQKLADLCNGQNIFQLWSLRADLSALPKDKNSKALVELHFPDSMVVDSNTYNAQNAGAKECYAAMIFIEPINLESTVVSDSPVTVTASYPNCTTVSIKAPSATTNGFANVKVELTGDEHSLKLDETASNINISFSGKLKSLIASANSIINLTPGNNAKIENIEVLNNITITSSGNITCDTYHVDYQAIHMLPKEIKVNNLILEEGSATIAMYNQISNLNYSYIPSDLAILVANHTTIENMTINCNLEKDDLVPNNFEDVEDMIIVTEADSIENIAFTSKNQFYNDQVDYSISSRNLYIIKKGSNTKLITILAIAGGVGVALVAIIVGVCIYKKKNESNKLNSTPLITTE